MNIENNSLPITLTHQALEEIKKLKGSDEDSKDFLRIGVKGGGCAGFSYILEFDVKGDNDEMYDFGGLKIVIDKTHALYLHGIVIDFKLGLDNRGFLFDNPNATTTCGCGTSFSA